MKEIKLKKIELHNFRGKAEQTIEFKTGFTTVISGRNASGKSRVFNAFIWCLFGKDSLGRKDYNVKTIVNGEDVKKTDVAVTVTLSVDGNTTELTRVLKEKWTKPRGQVDEVFSGNVTECYINQIPTKVTDYTKEVDTIVSERLFQVLTQTHYFVELPWQQQREILLEMAGAVEFADIAKNNADYAELLNRITGKSVEDYRKEVAANKRLAKKELETIQPKIQQTNKLMPEKADEMQINAKLDELNAELKSIEDMRTASQSEKEQKQREVKANISALQAEVASLEAQQKDAVSKTQQKENKRCEELNKEYTDIKKRLADAQSERVHTSAMLKNKQDSLASLKEDAERIDKKLAALRSEWMHTNEQEMDEDSTICHACGQPLPASRIEEVRNNFAANKQKQLADINSRGKKMKAEKENMTALIEKKAEEITRLNKELEGYDNRIANLQASFDKKKPVQPVSISPLSIPAYNKLQTEKDGKEKEIEALKKTIDASNQLHIDAEGENNRIDELKVKIKNLEEVLQEQRLREKYTEEIENLEAQGRTIAKEIAMLEKDEYITTCMIKSRIEESEKRINAMFADAITFKLFEYTLDGNPIECCIPLVNGVPYPVVNKADRLNAALSIIETLSHHYDVCAPIFVDDAEGVNNINPTTAQQIHLQVTNDEFKVTYF